MTPTLISTRPTRLRTRLQLQTERIRVAMAGAGEKLTGDVAYVGAIQVQANALHLCIYILLRQTRIRADLTNLRAIKTRLDATHRHIAV
jgi:hypothetical protein